jgi:hypothetical protein
MEEKQRIYDKVGSIIRQGDKKSYIGEDDFVSLVKNGVTINFHVKNSSLDIENVFRTVKRAQKIVHDRFDYYPEDINISLYSSIAEMREEGRSKSRYASWIAGIFDGKIRVVAENEEEEPESLYIILTHEILHLAVYEITGGLCPYWLDEGLAVHLSQGLSDEYLETLKKAVKSDRIVPLEVLEKPLATDLDEVVRRLVYAEASSITEYLIESQGWDSVVSILKQCKRKSIKTILADFSLNYYLVEQEWKRWIRGKSE